MEFEDEKPKTAASMVPCWINYLHDLSLMEILLRLPTLKYATQCKLVCKNWNSLISNPYFVRRFIDHHHHIYSKEPRPFAMIVNVRTEIEEHKLDFHIISKDPLSKSIEFKLKFLPFSSLGVRIIASYRDLILCRALKLGHSRVYCICNPFTVQWIALPPYPLEDELFVSVGFVCDNKSCKVVRIHREGTTPSSFLVEIFSSETWQWQVLVVLHSQNLDFKISFPLNIFGWNGMLYWLTPKNDIVAYNPYKPQQCHLINGPKDVRRHTNHVGLCQGSLGLLQFFQPDFDLKVWKLDDYITGKWDLKHEVCLKTLIIGTVPTTLQQETYIASCTTMLALDPNDEDMVYFVLRTRVFSYHLQTKEVKEIDRTLCCQEFIYHPDDVLQLVLPSCPTTVPALLLSALHL